MRITQRVVQVLYLLSVSQCCVCADVTENGCPDPSQTVLDSATRYAQDRFDLPRKYQRTVKRVDGIECYFHVEFWSDPVTTAYYKSIYVTGKGTVIVGEIAPAHERYWEAEKQRAKIRRTQLAGARAVLNPVGQDPVSLVVFSDYQYPACKSLHDSIKDVIARRKGRSIQIFTRHFPLSYHPAASDAAKVAICAEADSRELFENVHYLLDRQDTLAAESIDAITENVLKEVSVDRRGTFRACLSSSATSQRLRSDIRMGLRNGVRSTPTIFVNGQTYKWSGDTVQLLTLINNYESQDSNAR